MHSKPVTLFAAFTVLAMATGCIVSGSSHTDQAFTLSWVVSTDTGTPSSCDEMLATTVDLILKNLDSGASFHDQFACTAGSGQTELLPAGRYQVDAALLDAAGTVLSQLSFPEQLVKGSVTNLGGIEFQAIPPGLWFTWEIGMRTSSGLVSVNCQQAGAATVELETQLGTAAPQVYVFACADMGGQTTAVVPGTYVIAMRLLRATREILSATQPESVAVLGRGHDLGNVVFEIN